MSCCDIITFHLMWKIIQSQWVGKCCAVYHRNWHCLLPLQHIICSISQSQLFSLSYCHTHSTTVYHMPHLTRRQCTHAWVWFLMLLVVFCVFCLFVFLCMSVDVHCTCSKINLSLAELCWHTSLCCLFLHTPFTPDKNMRFVRGHLTRERTAR